MAVLLFPAKIAAAADLTLLKSSEVSLTANSAWKGAICSRRMSKCLTRKSRPSAALALEATLSLAVATLAMQADKAS